MITKQLTFILTITLLGCTSPTEEKENLTSSIDTISKSYDEILTFRESAAAEKQTQGLGDLVSTVSFEVRTGNKKDFENGLIPWASIEKPGNDIPQLVDGKDIVISENKVTIIIDYPLTNEYSFDLESKNGFTRQQILLAISEAYHKLYAEEESSATVKTIPPEKRTGVYNRNQTNGKYGVWGHDIADLSLTEILVYKTKAGQIILSLNIES